MIQKALKFLHYKIFLAEAYLREKKFEESVKYYEKIIHLNITNAMMWNDYGYALEQIGRKEEAKNAYSKSLELDPSFIFAKRNLKRLNPKENLFKKIINFLLRVKNKQNNFSVLYPYIK